MVFHGFWLVSMVFQGGFMVFYGFWLVSMVFQVGFMVFHGFPWCNLKRRAGFDANILPPKRPVLSVADRVAKINNVTILEMCVMYL